MDSVIIAAIIGAMGAVIAALVGIWSIRLNRRYKDKKQFFHLNFDNYISTAHFDLIKTKDSLNHDSDTLFFITEDELPYRWDFRTGLSLNFTLRNGHKENIIIHSIKLELLDFQDSHSVEFKKVLRSIHDWGSSYIFSSQIQVHGVRVYIDPSKKQFKFFWGAWDDTADSRGIVYKKLDKQRYTKMFELISRLYSNESMKDKSLITITESEILPPSLRFSQSPGDTDSFYCQISGLEEGIYYIRFVLGYHLKDEIRNIYSDKAYIFIAVDYPARQKGGYPSLGGEIGDNY